jgi:hypothetical protein
MKKIPLDKVLGFGIKKMDKAKNDKKIPLNKVLRFGIKNG